MQGAGGGGWSRLRAPSFGAGGRRGAAAEEAAGTRSGSQYSSAPAEAGICSRLICPRLAQTRTCRVSVIWVHCCRGHTSQPPLGPPRSLSRAPWLCLCPPGSGSSCGCGCDSRSRLLSSASCTARRRRLRAQGPLSRRGETSPNFGFWGEPVDARNGPGLRRVANDETNLRSGPSGGGEGWGLEWAAAWGRGWWAWGLLKRNSQKLAWEWSCRPPRGQSLGV